MIINMNDDRVIVFKTIYDYFNDYSKERMDNVLMLLTVEERELIRLKYGHDINSPTFDVLNSEQLYTFYHSLIPKIKRLLECDNIDKIYYDNLNDNFNSINKKLSLINCYNIILNEDYEKALDNLMYPRFYDMMPYLNVKEIIVTFLRFGYVNNKIFSEKAISEFLHMNIEEVNYIIIKAVSLYKEIINEYVDAIIDNSFGNVRKRCI